jgi:peptidoglycan/LPS O-acetylase OafA/YrhL
MPDNADPIRAYRPDIDGLRALAIILVVAYHYFGLPGGYVGVDVFFVISGYLITGILLSDLDGQRFSFVDFYARRFRRILPPVLLVIVTSLLVGWVCLLPYDVRELSEEAWASAVYALNFLLLHESGYFDVAATTKPLLHLWSLSVEEQFYLVWPAFLLLANWCRRVDLGILGIVVASLLVNLITIQNDQAIAFYFPVSRLWELAAGGLLVQLERGRNGTSLDPYGADNWPRSLRSGLSILGLALILSAATLYTSEMRFPGYLALIPVIGAVLVLAGGPNAWPNARILAYPLMVHVGKRSYSLYLWHWPVLVLATLIFGDLHPTYLKEECLIGSCILAWAAYRWCEWPIRKIPINVGSAWRFITVGIGASVAIATGGFLIASGTLSRVSDSALITKKYPWPQYGCAFDSSAGAKPNMAIFAPCEVLRYPGRQVVVLIGDSHAAALYWGLKPYLDARQINLIEYSAIGCGPFSIVGASPSCAATYEYVLGRIKRNPPNLVILCAHYLNWTYRFDAGYAKVLVQRMAQLRRAGPQNVLIVGQMPIWGNTLPWILNQEYLRLGQRAPTRMFTGLLPDSLKIDETMSFASETLGVPYYSVKQQFCNAQGCLTRIGDRLPDDLIVFDDGHLTIAGSQYLSAGGLGQRVDSLLAARKLGP